VEKQIADVVLDALREKIRGVTPELVSFEDLQVGDVIEIGNELYVVAGLGEGNQVIVASREKFDSTDLKRLQESFKAELDAIKKDKIPKSKSHIDFTKSAYEYLSSLGEHPRNGLLAVGVLTDTTGSFKRLSTASASFRPIVLNRSANTTNNFCNWSTDTCWL